MEKYTIKTVSEETITDILNTDVSEIENYDSQEILEHFALLQHQVNKLDKALKFSKSTETILTLESSLKACKAKLKEMKSLVVNNLDSKTLIVTEDSESPSTFVVDKVVAHSIEPGTDFSLTSILSKADELHLESLKLALIDTTLKWFTKYSKEIPSSYFTNCFENTNLLVRSTVYELKLSTSTREINQFSEIEGVTLDSLSEEE